MSVVLSLKVVQQGLVKALISVQIVEQIGETYEGSCRNESENNLIFGYKSHLKGLPALSSCNFLYITVNIEVKRNRIDDRIDLEVYT